MCGMEQLREDATFLPPYSTGTGAGGQGKGLGENLRMFSFGELDLNHYLEVLLSGTSVFSEACQPSAHLLVMRCHSLQSRIPVLQTLHLDDDFPLPRLSKHLWSEMTTTWDFFVVVHFWSVNTQDRIKDGPFLGILDFIFALSWTTRK